MNLANWNISQRQSSSFVGSFQWPAGLSRSDQRQKSSTSEVFGAEVQAHYVSGGIISLHCLVNFARNERLTGNYCQVV